MADAWRLLGQAGIAAFLGLLGHVQLDPWLRWSYWTCAGLVLLDVARELTHCARRARRRWGRPWIR